MLGSNPASGSTVRLAFASLMLGSGSDSDSISTLPSEFPVYHPVPASCSVRLLFVSFMVRISSSFCIRFSSFFVRFSSFFVRLRSVRPVRFVPVRFRSSCRFVHPVRRSVRFEIVPYAFRPLTGDLFIYFPRILYTIYSEFQMYFLPKNMCFLRIVAFFRCGER